MVVVVVDRFNLVELLEQVASVAAALVDRVLQELQVQLIPAVAAEQVATVVEPHMLGAPAVVELLF